MPPFPPARTFCATPPVAAGSYAVAATITDPNYQGSTIGILVIRPASATVTLGSLDQVYDGNPKPVTVATVPEGLACSITYDGSPAAPSAVGSYAIVATLTDPNYQGSASGALNIAPADGYAAWVDANHLNGPDADMTADPDGDGLADLLEYALHTDPLVRSDPLTVGIQPDTAETPIDRLTMVFQRPIGLPDVSYHVWVSGDLIHWQEVTDITLVADPGGETETVTARDSQPASAGHRFMRLEVRQTP